MQHTHQKIVFDHEEYLEPHAALANAINVEERDRERNIAVLEKLNLRPGIATTAPVLPTFNSARKAAPLQNPQSCAAVELLIGLTAAILLYFILCWPISENRQSADGKVPSHSPGVAK